MIPSSAGTRPGLRLCYPEAATQLGAPSASSIAWLCWAVGNLQSNQVTDWLHLRFLFAKSCNVLKASTLGQIP
jgi:hypothetical protein